MKAKFKRGAAAYRNVQTTAAAQYADSIQLTQMLFSALLESLAEAEGHINRNDFEKKASSLSRANKILLGLQGSLDFNKGKDLSMNLSDIYEYSIRRHLACLAFGKSSCRAVINCFRAISAGSKYFSSI